MAEPVIRLAGNADLDALVRLEAVGFASDRFTEEQIEYLVTRAHASVFVLEQDGVVAGGAYMLWRRSLKLGRLYNIVLDPGFQGKGFGSRLLTECEIEAARRGCEEISLEVRTDNTTAIAFYRKYGYQDSAVLDDYYEDGSTGLRMVKRIALDVPHAIRLKIPYYSQTLDFTCGAACLMMAFRHFKPEMTVNRTTEVNLWKESTLVFMTSGIGGIGPFGLSLSAAIRGFEARVLLSSDQTPFFKSVRIENKREIIRLVHADLKKRSLDNGVAYICQDFPFEEISSALYRDLVPIVLISTYRLTGDRAPHWVVVTGFDEKNVYIHDPDIESYDGNTNKVRNLSIPRAEFERIRQYGRHRFKAAILIGPGRNKSVPSSVL